MQILRIMYKQKSQNAFRNDTKAENHYFKGKRVSYMRTKGSLYELVPYKITEYSNFDHGDFS